MYVDWRNDEYGFCRADYVYPFCSSDRAVKLWDAASGAVQHALEDNPSRVNVVPFSPDGKMLVSTSDDRIVKLWDAASGALQHTLKGHSSRVNTVAFSPDGYLADLEAAALWEDRDKWCRLQGGYFERK
jgi:WD40 repeat protein